MNTDLIAKYLAGECSEAEKAQLESWLAASADNRRSFETTQQLWEASSRSRNITTDTAQQWELLTAVMPQQKRSVPVWMKYAAALIPIALCIGYLLFQRSPSDPMQWVVNDQTQPLKILLPDSTEVWLRSGAYLGYPQVFKRTYRKVQLKGNAYFKVTSDKTRPFTVVSGETEIQVLGTEFNVKEIGGVEVSVYEGKVSVAEILQPQNHQILVQNETAVFSTHSKEIKKLTFADPNEIAWKTGILVFDNRSLEAVCAVLERYYKVTISLSPTVVNCPITTMLDNLTLAETLEVLSSTLGIEAKQTAEGILISGNCQ